MPKGHARRRVAVPHNTSKNGRLVPGPKKDIVGLFAAASRKHGLKFAVSEDGRLHGEKYFHTVREEFGMIRPAFRWRQLVALGRVTASAYGYNREDKPGFRAAGYEEACKLLGVEA